MIAARSGRTDITNILLEGEHIDLDIQENVSVLLQAPNTLIDMFSHKSYCLHRLEDGQLSTSLLRMETQLPHMLSSKQELMSTSKTRSGIAINSISFKLCFSVQNGWTALEIAEVKSADEEAAIIPEWYEVYMCDGYKGVRDYGIVIELLRGNLVEPVTPPTHHVSPQNILSSSAVIHTSVPFSYCTVLYSGVFSCQKR